MNLIPVKVLCANIAKLLAKAPVPRYRTRMRIVWKSSPADLIQIGGNGFKGLVWIYRPRNSHPEREIVVKGTSYRSFETHFLIS